jgi:hypothetical protein
LRSSASSAAATTVTLDRTADGSADHAADRAAENASGDLSNRSEYAHDEFSFSDRGATGRSGRRDTQRCMRSAHR